MIEAEVSGRGKQVEFVGEGSSDIPKFACCEFAQSVLQSNDWDRLDLLQMEDARFEKRLWNCEFPAVAANRSGMWN